MIATVTCLECQKIFEKVHTRKFCSIPCRNRYNNKKLYILNKKSITSTGTKGAICELLVSSDLLERGFQVFRALSPSCNFDLAVLTQGTLLGIEVRTAYRTRKGALMYMRKFQDADVFGLCLMENTGNKIIYEPITEKGKEFCSKLS